MPTLPVRHLNATFKNDDEFPYTAQENEENMLECLHVVKYGVEICKQLCLRYDDKKYFFAVMKECEDICLQIGIPTKKVCPLNSGCASGCPCSDYLCSKSILTKKFLLLEPTAYISDEPFLRQVLTISFFYNKLFVLDKIDKRVK